MGLTSVVAVEEECAELEREGDEGREKGGGEEVVWRSASDGAWGSIGIGGGGGS
jgi:hypothetical protein